MSRFQRNNPRYDRRGLPISPEHSRFRSVSPRPQRRVIELSGVIGTYNERGYKIVVELERILLDDKEINISDIQLIGSDIPSIDLRLYDRPDGYYVFFYNGYEILVRKQPPSVQFLPTGSFEMISLSGSLAIVTEGENGSLVFENVSESQELYFLDKRLPEWTDFIDNYPFMIHNNRKYFFIDEKSRLLLGMIGSEEPRPSFFKFLGIRNIIEYNYLWPSERNTYFSIPVDYDKGKQYVALASEKRDVANNDTDAKLHIWDLKNIEEASPTIALKFLVPGRDRFKEATRQERMTMITIFERLARSHRDPKEPLGKDEFFLNSYWIKYSDVPAYINSQYKKQDESDEENEDDDNQYSDEKTLFEEQLNLLLADIEDDMITDGGVIIGDTACFMLNRKMPMPHSIDILLTNGSILMGPDSYFIRNGWSETSHSKIDEIVIKNRYDKDPSIEAITCLQHEDRKFVINLISINTGLIEFIDNQLSNEKRIVWNPRPINPDREADEDIIGFRNSKQEDIDNIRQGKVFDEEEMIDAVRIYNCTDFYQPLIDAILNGIAEEKYSEFNAYFGWFLTDCEYFLGIRLLQNATGWKRSASYMNFKDTPLRSR
jgi:hypothetical protein